MASVALWSQIMTILTNPLMHFEVIKDYRQAGKVTHKLSDIILLMICGVISGEGICDFGNFCLKFLKTYGDFSQGIRRCFLNHW
jgi:predicted transposase YbfD/YdcC